jgi:hypothetical protein
VRLADIGRYAELDQEVPEQLVDEPGPLARLPAYGLADPDDHVHEPALQPLLSAVRPGLKGPTNRDTPGRKGPMTC